MKQQTKLTATIIWLASLSGLFMILNFAAGGFGTLSGEMNVQSAPLMLVGIVPLAVGVFGRMVVMPKAKTDEAFMGLLVFCLALCEMPAILAMFVFPKELVTERTFAFIGSVLGILVLFPLNIRNNS